MSRCFKYQKSGQGVGVGFCHSCHSVKMRQKHLGLLESSRGPPHHVQTDTCLVSDHTYRWGPFVINDFFNLTNSSESHLWTVIHPRRYLWICPLQVYMFKKIGVSKGKYTIQTTKRKEPRHASVLVWVYNDRNLIIWRCSYICRTRRESLRSEIGFFFGIYCLSQRRSREYDPEGFLCMRLCVCVCVRACGRPVDTTPSDDRPLPDFWPNLV